MARPRAQQVEQSSWLSDREAAATRDLHGRPLLRLQTLGAAVIQCGDLLRITPTAGVLFALVLRLTHAPGMRVSRNVLLESLWPEQVDSKRRGSLRQALYKLRSYDVRVGHGGSDIELDATQVVRTFSMDRTSDRFEREVLVGREPFGTFLPGYAPHWPAVAEWLQVEREAVHADIRRVLVQQLRARRERADWTGAEPLARWLLQFDPLHEDATLMLAECTMLAGAKAEAIAILDRYLAEIGPGAGDIRLPATLLRRRFAAEGRGRLSFAPSERHFVGREQEIADLTMAMRRSRWHDGSAVLYHGPAGIGKTRLTLEAAKVAAIEGIRDVRIACRESDSQRPLAILLEILPSLIALPGALGCEPASLKTLRRLVGGGVGEGEGDRHEIEDSDLLASNKREAIRPKASIEDDAGDEWTRMAADPMQMASSIRRSIVDLVSAVADERPLLIIVDDIQWIDSSSWDALCDLMERAATIRVVILMTSRNTHARLSRPETVPNSLVSREVRPLSATAATELAKLIGDDFSAPFAENLCAWFVGACEGSPLYLKSLVNHWIETGEAGGVPPTLVQAIEQRLARLSADALRSLQAAALLGTHSSIDRLRLVLGFQTHELLSSIECLELSGSLAEASTGRIVVHELVRQSALRRLSPFTSSALHKRIAEVLADETPSSTSPATLFQIAEHWRASGDNESFTKFVASHVSLFVESGSPAAALQVIESAIAINPEFADANNLAATRSRLRLDAGEYAKALQERAGLLSLPPLSESLSHSEVLESLALVDAAYRADAFADRSTLLEFAAAASELTSLPSTVRLRAAEVALVIASNTSDSAVAKRCVHGSGALSEGSSTDDASRRVALLYHTIFGERDVSHRIAHHLFQQAKRMRATTQRYHDLCRSAYALRFSGTLEEVLHAYTLGYETAMELELPRLAQYPAWQLSAVLFDAGQFGDADYWNSRLLALFETEDDKISSNFIPAHLCRIAILRGKADEARLHVSDYARLLPRLPVAVATSFVTALQLGVELLDGSWTPSEDLLVVAKTRHARTAPHCASDFFTAKLAESFLRAGRVEVARGILSDYLNTQRREVMPVSFELELAQKAALAAPPSAQNSQS